MKRFAYSARNRANQSTRGVVEALNEDTAAEILLEQGLTVITLTELREPLWRRAADLWGRVRTRDRVVFFRQLSVLISANVPIVQSLRVLIQQVNSAALKRTVAELADEVDGGAKLSQAMERYPHIFSNLERSIIQTGESSGKLDDVLEYLATQEERDYDLVSKVRGAMIYPAIVTTLLIGVATFTIVAVIPKLTAILEESGAELPLPTRILIGASDFLIGWWWALLFGLVGAVAGLRWFVSLPYGRWQLDHLKLKLPIFGKLWQRMYLVRFCRSLQTLLVGGVSVTRALDIAAEVAGNVLYQQIIAATIKEVEEGHSIGTVFARSPIIPPMVPQMMVIGEQTGKLDEILDKISQFYGREIDNLVRNLASLIEPLIIIVIAAGVAMLLGAVVLPIYSIYNVS